MGQDVASKAQACISTRPLSLSWLPQGGHPAELRTCHALSGHSPTLPPPEKITPCLRHSCCIFFSKILNLKKEKPTRCNFFKIVKRNAPRGSLAVTLRQFIANNFKLINKVLKKEITITSMTRNKCVFS